MLFRQAQNVISQSRETLKSFVLLTEDGLHIWNFDVREFGPVSLLELGFPKVFRIIANVLEDIQTGSCSSVRVYVEAVRALNLLEKSHSGVPLVVFHHSRVFLSDFDVGWRVLENASGSIRALAWVVQEVLTDWSQVLSAQVIFLLKLFLSMGKTASLFFDLVLTLKAFQPEPTQFSLDLAFPSILLLGVPAGLWRGTRIDFNDLFVPNGPLILLRLDWAFNNALEWNSFLQVWVGVAALRWGVCCSVASCHWSGCVKEGSVLIADCQVEDWEWFRNLFSCHLCWSRCRNESLACVENHSLLLGIETRSLG